MQIPAEPLRFKNRGTWRAWLEEHHGTQKDAWLEYYFLRFSPRKRGSLWSVSNQKRVEQLVADGQMTEAGLAKVREAQENGQWAAAIAREEPSNLPDDLIRALASNAEAQAHFERLPASQKNWKQPSGRSSWKKLQNGGDLPPP